MERVQRLQLIQVLEGTDADGMPMELFFSTVRKGPSTSPQPIDPLHMRPCNFAESSATA